MAKNYGMTADGKVLKSQWETILYYLQSNEGASITSWEAIKEFGFTRLSGIVKQIEYRTGIRLERRDEKHTTRFGATCYFTRYWYKGEDK